MNIRKIFYEAGLKAEIVTATAVLIIITTMVSSAYFYTKTKAGLFESEQERGKTICENLSRSAKYGVLTEDKIALDELVSSTTLFEDVVYVVIMNSDGQTLAEKTSVKIPDTTEITQNALKTKECQASLRRDNLGNFVYTFCLPIVAKKISLAEIGGIDSGLEEDTSSDFRGMVHVGLSLNSTMTKLNEMLRGIIALTVAIVGCGILFSTTFARLIMRPIEKMALAASKVAAGDLMQTVHVDSKDEIGLFAKQFNIMTTALRIRDEQLNKSYSDLTASEERYRVFIQNSTESIWCFEPKDGKPYVADSTNETDLITEMLTNSAVVECNDTTAKLYKAKRREELIGSHLGDLLPPADPVNIEHLKTFIRNGYRLTEVEKEYIDGQNRQVFVTNFLGTSENGKLLRVWVIQRDITDIKRAEQLQTQLFAKVQETNQELKDFAYVASHDLKAPLRGIKTLAEWIAKDYADKFDDAGREQLRLLSSRVERMHNLIDGILQYSRVGHIHENPLTINLNDMVPDIIDMLAPPANIEITIENTLPTITFEETRIRQVFQNLISNAIKYMDKPQGKISIACEDKDAFWQFSVTDNGPGIDEKYHEKIFKIFQTLSARDDYESTGIGLTLVKKIVEMYGGKVWVQSKTGEGSTFLFTISKKQNKQIKYEKSQTNIAD